MNLSQELDIISWKFHRIRRVACDRHRAQERDMILKYIWLVLVTIDCHRTRELTQLKLHNASDLTNHS